MSKGPRWTPEQFQEHQRRRNTTQIPTEGRPSGRSKMGSRAALARDGTRFQSELERDYYEQLLLRQQAAGDSLQFFLRQVPFHLPGGVIYRLDFLEFHEDSTPHSPTYPATRVRAVDVKGFETDTFKMKKKLVEALYPIEIQVISRDRIRRGKGAV